MNDKYKIEKKEIFIFFESIPVKRGSKNTAHICENVHTVLIKTIVYSNTCICNRDDKNIKACGR